MEADTDCLPVLTEATIDCAVECIDLSPSRRLSGAAEMTHQPKTISRPLRSHVQFSPPGLIVLAMGLVLASHASAVADDPAIDRIEPPSWWTAARPQQISLLIEGRNLDGATAEVEGGALPVGRLEHGLGGKAMLVEITIPVGAKPGDLHVELLCRGRRIRHPWTLHPAPGRRPEPFGPDDIIYLIMPDRFADADPRNNETQGGDRMLDRASPDAYHGGDFRGILERLPYLKDLGVTAIWLTPIYRPDPRWLTIKAGTKVRRMAEYHGYCPVDFYDTNPRFGTMEEYRKLVSEAHRIGLKVIQDQILGYTGPRHHWARATPFDGWFHGSITDPPVCTFRYEALTNPHADATERRGVTDGWFFGLLPDLDTRNPRVRRYAIQQSLWWAARFEADGIRLDTYPLVEREFWRDWSRERELAVPGLAVVGEAWVHEPADLCFFQGGRPGWDGIDPGVDSVFDFPLYQAITQVFSGKAPATRLAGVLARDGLYPRPERLVTFVDNHDTPRLAALPGVGPARYHVAVAFLLTTRGIPQMTWGDELGLPGHMDDRRDFPGGFAGDPRDAFVTVGRTPAEQATFETWRTLIKLRRSSEALRRGRLIDLSVSDATYVYLREAGDERLVIALNLGPGPAAVRIPAERIKGATRVETLYGTPRARLDTQALALDLPGESAAVLRVLNYQIHLDAGHPWRPPFGLDRVGRPITAVVETGARPSPATYALGVFVKGKEVGRHPVQFPIKPPYSARVTLESDADELVLSSVPKPAEKPVELARQAVHLPEFEADAIARPDRVVNPVDLGTILVPSGWLLLGPGQSATLEIAAISRTRDLPRARLKSWFDAAPGRVAASPISLRSGVRTRLELKLPEAPPAGDRDVLSVVLDDGAGHELWRKALPVMLARDPPRRPRFGATYERLRYDAPISLREPGTGKFSSLRYEDAWKPELRDVVVWLPNGARYVFWRGSSYIPFWAGLHNTGACYEWAEVISQPQGAVDCVEPLMDKELRYGRVEIVESTSARVHVRWSYQSTDFDYKVWGDAAVEDYYFYPDGFGTRVVNLKADPKNDYELSEFIILTPQGAYPFAVLPENPVDALYLDGWKHEFRFPNPTAKETAGRRLVASCVPAVYRLRLNPKDPLAAVYFNPNETKLPPVVFAPFFDGGQMVTPCYWGSHWPLARGNSTGRTIDDRIQFTPCHNSVMSWAGTRPTPLRTADLVTLDTLGRPRRMSVRRWAWLIGMSDAPDRRLREWGRSFTTPPSLELDGARLDFEAYVPERRAIRLVAEEREVWIALVPRTPCVNPVFEWVGAPQGEVRVTLDGRPLDAAHLAWDGRTLWLDATIEKPAELRVTFGIADAGRVP